MKRTRNFTHRSRSGSVLVLTLIMITMLSALALALAGLSGARVQVAENIRKRDNTRGSAESGLEVMRYWMSQVAMSGKTLPSDRFSQLASKLQSALTTAPVTKLAPVCSDSTITVSNVPLNSRRGQTFSAILTKIDDDNVRLEVTGCYGSLSRTIQSSFRFGERAHTVFDFGVVSRGPISLAGNVELNGVNIQVESNAFIVSEDSLLALSITGNSRIAGDVKTVNPPAYVHLQGVTLVETPNVVSFSGGVDITGMIVTDGSQTDNSRTNQIPCTGNGTNHPIDQLPQQPQFEGLHSQTGTFMLAPGFQASCGGSFGTPSGAIAAHGIRFYGNAGGTINRSIVNYSDSMTELSGNGDLYFNRSGLTEVPAGFVPEIILHYEPSSYAETVL